MLDNQPVQQPDDDPLVAALRRLVESTPGGRKAVAATIAAHEQSLYQILSGVTHPKTQRRRGVGPALRDRLTQHFPHWLDTITPERVPPLAGTHPGASLAHQLSQVQPTIKPTTIEWEQLMSMGPLPEVFCVVLPDDAMAPEFPKGCTVTFSTTEGPPRPRDAVLVRDQGGHVLFREYLLKTPDHWMAAATGGGLLPLDSRADGLQVLAICVGKWGRRG